LNGSIHTCKVEPPNKLKHR